MSEPRRTERFQKDEEVEEALQGLNEELSALEPPESSEEISRPVIFIVGAPRSATTPLYQVLAGTGRFTYPSNLMARFWDAPWIGAKVELALHSIEHDESQGGIESSYGVTPGLSGPHEFGYFWQRWFPPSDTHRATSVDFDDRWAGNLRAELASTQSVRGLPLLFKNLVTGLHIPELARALPEARFVVMERSPPHTVQSILEGRKEVHGDLDAWFSLKPPSDRGLYTMDGPEEQVALQVAETYRAIDEGLRELPEKRQARVSYSRLCEQPEVEVRRLLKELEGLVHRRIEGLSRLTDHLENRNQQRVSNESWKRILSACEAADLHDRFDRGLSRDTR